MPQTGNGSSNENAHDMRNEKLSEVTLPAGAPLLMQAQTFPWNGDGYLAGEVLRLQKEHGLHRAIETGTCLGVTTSWLMHYFHAVHTCELHPPFFRLAKDFLIGKSGTAYVECTDSPSFIASVLKDREGPWFIFLDAHGISGSGKEACPLLDELNAIAEVGAKPCLLIHDFQVPGTDFGYDCMPDGRPFNLDLIRPYLNRIYGEGRWMNNYPNQVAGAMRGWISIEPS